VSEVAGGLLVGAAFGALAARNTVCFNAGVRRAAFERRWRILDIFAVAVAAQLLLLPALDAAGVDPLEQAVEGGPELLPVAQLAGGLVFGAGMALAGGCIAGILWKTGAGSIATGLAVAGFAAGELVARGPGADVLAELDDASRPAERGIHGLLGLPYWLVAVPLGAAVLVALRRRGSVGAGLAVGAVGAAAWVAADLAGYGYGLGFTGTAANVRDSVEAADAGALSFQAFLATGVILGAAAGVRGPLRLPDRARALRAVAGGVLMGLGANAAHGCNIGHGLTGIPLLALGSLLAIAAMAAGVVATWGLLLARRPGLRGTERPEPSW
jgi:hypothetical protein